MSSNQGYIFLITPPRPPITHKLKGFFYLLFALTPLLFLLKSELNICHNQWIIEKVLDAKLLHPGVNTGDILTAYIAAIRALRVLDGSGVILELVCVNVRKYLKTREDTVKCIVESLLDESAMELREELMKGGGIFLPYLPRGNIVKIIYVP